MMNQPPTNSALISDDALKHATPHMLAVTMLQHVMDETNGWRNVEPAITAEVLEKVPMACDFYELRILLDLIEQRFGAGVSELVQSSLITVTNLGRKQSGDGLFSKFMSAITLGRELGPSNDAPDNKKIGVDCQVADQILAFINETEEEKKNFRLVLAESLTYARVWAENIFPGLVARIEFDPMSIAFVKVESGYRGLTNRWSKNPGRYERHLQRMEGNLLFEESQRNPSDEEIGVACAQDEADYLQLRQDVETLFDDIRILTKERNAESKVVIDLMQHRLQPLMIRAAEIGALPQATKTLGALMNIGDGCLNSLSISEKERQGFRQMWAQFTNVFYAQAFSENSPIQPSDLGAALLCETTEDFEAVIGVLQQLNPELVRDLADLATSLCEIAVLDGFHIPAAAEKLELFSVSGKDRATKQTSQSRPWWKGWGSKTTERS
jgi:hypothetical protein